MLMLFRVPPPWIPSTTLVLSNCGSESTNEALASHKVIGVAVMGISDPEIRKKLSEPKWVRFKHESEKQGWPWWKRLIHRIQGCPICETEKVKER